MFFKESFSIPTIGMACPMFGKYAIRSCSHGCHHRTRGNPAEDHNSSNTNRITVRIFIKQRYIVRLNNPINFVQASEIFAKKMISKPITKDKFKIRRKRCFMTQKGILAFSGGSDTSVVVKYLQDEHDMDVVTVDSRCWSMEDNKKLQQRQKLSKKHYNIDARKEFVKDYIFPSIKANALYQKNTV